MHGEPQTPPHAGLLTRVLCATTASSARRPGWTLLLVLLSTVLALGISARFLKFKTSRAELFDPRADFQQRWLDYVERFGEQADLVVVLEGDDSAAIRRAMDDLGAKLLAEPQTFDRVTWKFDPSPLQRKGLQFLSPRELEEGLHRLETFAPILSGHWDRAGLEPYCRQLIEQAEAARKAGHDPAAEETLRQAALLGTSLTQFVQTLQTAGTGATAVNMRAAFVSPWPEIFPGAAEKLQAFVGERYQLSADETMGFILADPVGSQQTDFVGTSPAITRLRTLADEAMQRYPEVRVSLTGIPVLESDEMKQSQEDMSLATILSFAGVAFLMLLGFRGFRHPILGQIMLGVGMAWALGYTTLVVGHLNILSSSFGAILIGIGIDFAIIYLTRYIELRHQGQSLDEALVQTSAGVGTGIVTASVTGASAFFCATFTSFLGVAELGLIAAGGILLCSAATFIVLPPLVKLADGRVEAKRFATPFQGALMRRTTARYPGLVATFAFSTIILVSAFAFQWKDGRPEFRVRYDGNLLNMQAEGTESVAVQQRVFEKAQGSLLYAVSIAGSPEEARRRAAKFSQLPTVSHVEEFGSAMPRYPAEETSLLVQAFRARLAGLSALPRELPQMDPLSIGQSLEGLLNLLANSPLRECREASMRLDVFLSMLERMPLEQQMELLGGYQRAMLAALYGQFQAIAAAADPTPVSADDLDPGLRQRFVSPQGDWLLRIYPRDEVWEEEPLQTFVADIRSVDTNATGTPIQNYEGARQIRESYYEAALYALAIVSLILLIDSLETRARWIALTAPLIVAGFAATTLHAPNETVEPLTVLGLYVGTAIAVAAVFDIRNVCNMFLSMLPPVCGMAMTFGMLGMAGIDLNPANLIVLPLILGIGVDVGVHVVHDYRMQRGRYEISPSTINGIMMVSTTTMVGFGAMMISAHQGLASLGLVLTIGMGASLFVGLVTLPAMLTLVNRTFQRSAAVVPVPVADLRWGVVSGALSAEPRLSETGGDEESAMEERLLLPFPARPEKPVGIPVRRAS